MWCNLHPLVYFVLYWKPKISVSMVAILVFWNWLGQETVALTVKLNSHWLMTFLANVNYGTSAVPSNFWPRSYAHLVHTRQWKHTIQSYPYWSITSTAHSSVLLKQQMTSQAGKKSCRKLSAGTSSLFPQKWNGLFKWLLFQINLNIIIIIEFIKYCY